MAKQEVNTPTVINERVQALNTILACPEPIWLKTSEAFHPLSVVGVGSTKELRDLISIGWFVMGEHVRLNGKEGRNAAYQFWIQGCVKRVQEWKNKPAEYREQFKAAVSEAA